MMLLSPCPPFWGAFCLRIKAKMKFMSTHIAKNQVEPFFLQVYTFPFKCQVISQFLSFFEKSSVKIV